MTTSSNLPVATEPAALASLEFFGPAPLVAGEEVFRYDTLLARICGAVKPADILEEIWVRDVVDLVWDTIRLRRLKAALLTASADEGMAKVLARFEDLDRIGMARAWAAREAAAVAQVEALFAAAGLTMDAVMAQALRVRIDEIERIDRMIMGAEARRNVALRELEGRRARLAERLRQATHNVEDAEFEVVAAEPGDAA